MKDSKQMLATALNNQKFKQRGAAFFRVYGDGVLQVLKFEKERTCLGLILRIGLDSMYGELEPQWFTSSGCMTRYDLVNIIGERNSVIRGEFSSGFALQAYSLETQLELLECYGIPFLNSVGNQQQLAESLCYLESSWGGSVIWNDYQKFAPYLAANDLESAKKVLDAILAQHARADASHQKHSSKEAYLVWKKRLDAEDAGLYQLQTLIYKQDVEGIQEYLQKNYSNNCRLARFCMK